MRVFSALVPANLDDNEFKGGAHVAQSRQFSPAVLVKAKYSLNQCLRDMVVAQ